MAAPWPRAAWDDARGRSGDTMIRRRALVTAAVLAIGALFAASTPALAEDPPIPWQPLPGFPIVVDDVLVTWDTAEATTNPFQEGAFLEPIPMQRVDVFNGSSETRRFTIGIDTEVPGEILPFWNYEPLGDPENNDFVVELQPSQSFVTTDSFLSKGLPVYPGHTGVLYELVGPWEPPFDQVTLVELTRWEAPGGFVGIDLDGVPTADGVPPVGVEVTVAGPAGPALVPELFPGVTATAEASGLPPGVALDLYIAPGLDYFWFMIMGSNLPADVEWVGTTTTDASGEMTATFEVPPDAPLGRWQLIAGDRDTRWWPAGTYGTFVVTEPAASTTLETPAGASTTAFPFEVTTVEVGFPEGTGAGSTSTTVSTTGPVPEGFTLAGESAQVYYHLDSTAVPGGPVTVCVDYDPANIPDPPPYLYHHELVEGTAGQYRWVDITTSRTSGRVCGVTTSFSPFALGLPDGPAHDGSTEPPARAVLTHDNRGAGQRDGDFTITMTLPRGENASEVRLFEAGAMDAAPLATTALVFDSPNPQSASWLITGKPNGTYQYVAVLTNSTGETTTKTVTVKVKDAADAEPSTPPQPKR